ncbi:MAG: hypothetical protein ACOYOE_07050 [Chlorobium sp.]
MVKLWIAVVMVAACSFFSSTGRAMAAENYSLPQPAKVLLSGEITTGGVICPLLLGTDGQTIALVGVRLRQFETGTQLELEGVRVSRSPCQQGKEAFRVDRIVSINGVIQ